MKLTLLLVEDDIDLASTIVDFFEVENIVCDHAYNGVSGLSLATQNHYDVLILDLNLPGLDGIALCEQLRAQGKDTPVLMLTARDTLADKLAGFGAGTDDYLIKPFEVEELYARVLALSTRKSGQLERLALGKLSLCLRSKTADYEQKPIKLTPTTFTILSLLMREFPHPVSRQRMIQAVWGEDGPDSNSLKVHIFHLRKQLELAGASFSIATEAGFGFVLSQNSES